MAKSENTNSKAEAYREERKKRIAKAAKQSNKSSGKVGGASKILGKIVAIVLVIAIIGGVAWKIIDMTGVVDRASTVMTVSLASDASKKYDISSAEFSYYYYSQYSSVLSDIQNNGTDYGFDSTLPLEDQTTTDKDGATITWADAFRISTEELIKQQYQLILEANEAGYQLSDEEKTSINTNMDSLKSTAAKSNFSLNAYLKIQYGNGMNADLFRTIVENQTIAQSFYSAKSTELTDSPTDEAVAAEYKENQKLYDTADVRYKVITLTVLSGKEGETAEALKARQEASNKTIKDEVASYYGDVKDIESFLAADEKYEANKAKEAAEASDSAKKDTFKYDASATSYPYISYSTLETAVGTEAADWAFDSARKAGEVKYFETDKNLVYVCCVKPVYTTNSVDVRDCLISFNAEDESNPTSAEKETARKAAKELCDEWSAKEKTASTFAAMVKENSQDTSTAETGGLRDDLRISASVYGDDINNWIFDSGRKAGDYTIMEGKDGYHIFYFVSNNADDLDWKATVKSNLGTKAANEYFKGVMEGDKYTIVTVDKLVAKCQKKCCKTIKENLLAANASK